MLVSLKWLQQHFEKPLPDVEALTHAITLRAFEVENVTEHGDDTVIDIDVLPNRSSDCLCHYGIAKEISAILDEPMKEISEAFKFREAHEHKEDSSLEVTVKDSQKCFRYIGKEVKNVTPTTTPAWLSEKLEAIRQKSINHVVDVTNFVMFELGQPMHAFDADKVVGGEIIVRNAEEGESITTLDGKTLELDEDVLVIADAESPLAIAGVKGGKKAEVDENTQNIILESASFDPLLVRRASARLSVRTDSSKRFENAVSSTLSGAGMDLATCLLAQIGLENDAEPSFYEASDIYPSPEVNNPTWVNPDEIIKILGVEVSEKQMEDVFRKLDFTYEKCEPAQKITEQASRHLESQGVFESQAAFVSEVFEKSGVRVPKTFADQYVFGREIDESALEAGDLVFSYVSKEDDVKQVSETWMPGTEIPENANHLGIYLGDGSLAHLDPETKEVSTTELESSEYFQEIVSARRLVANKQEGYLLMVPSRRLDVTTLQEVAEEVGRIYEYENVDTRALPESSFTPKVEPHFFIANTLRNILTRHGFSEVLTHTLQDSGKYALKNPASAEQTHLRKDLSQGLTASLELNARYAPLLGKELIKIFEIGKIFPKPGEKLVFGLALKDTVSKKDKRINAAFDAVREDIEEAFSLTRPLELKDGMMEVSFDEFMENQDSQSAYGQTLETDEQTKPYAPFSVYPFILRDIAVFLPEEESSSVILDTVRKYGGELLVNHVLFDVFPKEFENGEKKVSYAFHLVFQSYDRTLSDAEVGEIMEKIESELNAKEGFSVR